jgi:Ca2+-binding RTX toxin-like protein
MSDTASPYLNSSTPSSYSSGHAVHADLVLKFNEPIKAGPGSITLADANGNVLLQEKVEGNPRITISGDTLTWNPADDMVFGADYVFKLDLNGITDLAGNTLTGKIEFPFRARQAARNLAGTSGDDKLFGGDGDDTLSGGDGRDTLWGGEGDDRLIGGSGDDQLFGETGNNILEGGDGDDSLDATFDRNELYGGAGNDHLRVLGYNIDSLLDGGDGDDRILGFGGNRILGGAGNDRIEVQIGGGATSATTIDAGPGADSIYVWLHRSTGDVQVRGGTGSDTFELDSWWDSAYTITDFTPGAGGDLISFTRLGLKSNPFDGSTLKLEQDGNDALLRHSNGKVVLRLQNVQAGSITKDNFVGGFDPLGGSAGATILGSDGGDRLGGQALDDKIFGFGGRDVIAGGYGDDHIDGGDEAGAGDYLDGGEGNDTLLGGAGNDELHGGAGGDTLDGGAGDDSLQPGEGNNTSRGGAGADTFHFTSNSYGSADGGDGDDRFHAGAAAHATLTGGSGNDVFVLDGHGWSYITYGINASGGTGDDVFRFGGSLESFDSIVARGDEGADLFQFEGGAASSVVAVQLADFQPGIDKLDLAGVLPAHVGNPFATGYLRLFEDADGLKIELDRDGGGSEYGWRPLLRLTGLKTGVLSAADFKGGFDPNGNPAGIEWTGTAGADTQPGTAFDDKLNGAGGFDHLDGLGGNDHIDGGSDDDTLSGGPGNDTVTGGTGNDRIDGGTGNDRIDGGDGDDWLNGGTGDDVLLGGAGNDELFASESSTLDGGAGNDRIFALMGRLRIRGGDGNDSITVQRGDANPDQATADEIDAGSGDDWVTVHGTSRSSATITVLLGGGRDHIEPRAGAERVVVRDFQAGAGGDVISLSVIFSPYSWTGGNPFDRGYLRLRDLDGNAVLEYDWHANFQSQPSGFLPILVLEGVKSASLTQANFSDGIDPLGGNKGMTVLGSDGRDVLAGSFLDDTIDGGAGNDEIHGSLGNDILRGGEGDDYLTDGNGHDTLDGGAGNDSLFLASSAGQLLGGGGDDTIAFRAYGTSGSDARTTIVIDGGDGADRIVTGFDSEGRVDLLVRGGSGSDVFPVSTGQRQNTVTIADFAGGAGGDKLDIEGLLSVFNWDNGNPFAVNGPLQFTQHGKDLVLTANARSDLGVRVVLSNTSLSDLTRDNLSYQLHPDGSSAGNVLTAPLGRATVKGGMLNDTLQGSIDRDSLHGLGGDDVIYGGDGLDFLYGGRGNDTLHGEVGDDYLFDEFGHNALYGGDGNDKMYLSGAATGEAWGGDGDDLIHCSDKATFHAWGGAGNDEFRASQDALLIAHFSGNRSGYQFDNVYSGMKIQGTDGADLAGGNVRLVFADRALAFDFDGQAGQAFRLYQAAFDRKPDAVGLGFWIAQLDQGVALSQVAEGFMSSPEFMAQYSTVASHSDFVGRLYQNILHRAPETAGLQYWAGLIEENKATRADVLAAIADSVENKAALVGAVSGGIDYIPYG